MGRLHSLLREHHELANPKNQLSILDNQNLPTFESMLEKDGLGALRSDIVQIFQINVGRVCNQACAHCHVDAAPDRKESMSRETMDECISAIAENDLPVVDITGGAPEMNPNFRYLVESVVRLNRKVIVRCNLTIIEANQKFFDLPDFYAKHGVEVIASLPFYTANRTDAQRGDGVFESSIRGLKRLNDAGYATSKSNLILNLVYNPGGAFLPSAQSALEVQFKKELRQRYSVEFNQLFCIANMPISRFLEYLLRTGNYNAYMERLVAAFNPAAARGVMCTNTISVGWNGNLYDCDFNQMLGLELNSRMHVRDFKHVAVNNRKVVTARHCFGCAAGSGSSCGGATV